MKRKVLIGLAVGSLLSFVSFSYPFEGFLNGLIDRVLGEFERSIRAEIDKLLENNKFGRNISDTLGWGSVFNTTRTYGITYTRCSSDPNLTQEEKIRCLTEGFLSSFQHVGKFLNDEVKKIQNPQDYNKVVDSFAAKLLESQNLIEYTLPARSFSYIPTPHPTADVYYSNQKVKDLYNAYLINQASRDALIKTLAIEYETYFKVSKKSLEEQEKTAKEAIQSIDQIKNDLINTLLGLVSSLPSFGTGIGAIDAIINMIRASAEAMLNAQKEIVSRQIETMKKELAVDVGNELRNEARKLQIEEINAKYNLAVLSMLSSLLSNTEMEYIRSVAMTSALRDYYQIKKDLRREVR